ncbi:MAG: hypothetical protein KME04_09810 [Pleurocapsa minor GSE-CHR-MK-17-07R]|jgi:3'(2'), 5'-bisphosphate nucleotidase|nr:hypothetical protein [Pleurocapsa minor GSE-CHR-MK 17-07R]
MSVDFNGLIAAMRVCATLTLRVQKMNAVGLMKEGEPVTIADYASQAVMCHAIAREFPDDAVLAEESGEQFLSLVSEKDRQLVATLVGEALKQTVSESQLVDWLNHGRGRDAARTWLIDPVDGTKGFIAGRRYSIALGMLLDGFAAGGLLACPGYPMGKETGVLLYAQGSAAWMTRLSETKAHRIAVAPEKKGLKGVRAVGSVEHQHADHDGMMQIFAKAKLASPVVERIDSQDKYGMVACGDADLYLRLPKDGKQHKVWDHAAGVAIVHAAGGAATDLDGSPLDFSHGRVLVKNKGMVVSSGGTLHDKILEALVGFPLDG